MKNPRRGPATTLLRWTFRRGDDFLTCRLDRARNGSFAVSVVPHGARHPESSETADTATMAFQLHGYTTKRLRESGWELVGYSNMESAAA